jgi:hypothetical protein
VEGRIDQTADSLAVPCQCPTFSDVLRCGRNVVTERRGACCVPWTTALWKHLGSARKAMTPWSNTCRLAPISYSPCFSQNTESVHGPSSLERRKKKPSRTRGSGNRSHRFRRRSKGQGIARRTTLIPLDQSYGIHSFRRNHTFLRAPRFRICSSARTDPRNTSDGISLMSRRRI